MLHEADKDKKEKRKVKGFKEFDGSKYINVEPTLDEATMPNAAVISFGRMNPVTNGHEKLVDKVNKVSNQVNGTPLVYLSHSQDKKKNPLSYEDKIKFAQTAFGPIVQKSPAKTIIQIAQSLTGKYKNLVMVVGSDRVKEFDSLLQKYNGKDFNFDSIKVVSAGQRDPDADDVSGMSASKMRALAANNDVSKFKKGLPKKLQSQTSKVLAAVRKGMNMSEENEVLNGEQLDEVLSRQQRRRRSIIMKRMKHKITRGREKAKRRVASMDVLKTRARKAAIMNLKKRFAKNRRYAELSAGEKMAIEKRISKFSKQRLDQMTRKLLPSIKKAERDRRRSALKKEDMDLNTKFEAFLSEGLWGMYNTKRPHQLMDEKGRVKFDKRFKMYNKKVNEELELDEVMDLAESVESFAEDYYKGVPKDKKDDRKAHFKRNAEKPGDGADKDSNYKPAPGDFKDGKRVKTKLSKHTKKYHDMYGESTELNEDPTASLKKKAEKTGMPMGILRKVYNRGVAAWKSGHRPGTTPEQWGHARVNSFVTKSSGTWGKADKDLAAKVRKEEVELDEVTQSATKKMVNVTGPDGKVRTVLKKSKTVQHDDQGQERIRSESINDKAEAFLESRDVDELNLSYKDATKSGNKPIFKAMKADKTKADLNALKAKLAKYGKAKNEESMEDLAHVANKAKAEKKRKVNNPKPDTETKQRTGIMDEEGGAGEEGTDKLVNKYKKDTPDA